MSLIERDVSNRVNGLLENLREPNLVEDPRVTIPVVEPMLELPYALHCSIHLLVPMENHGLGDSVYLPDSELRVEGSDVRSDRSCFTCHLSLNIFDPEAF